MRLKETDKATIIEAHAELKRVLADGLYPYKHLSEDVLEIFTIGLGSLPNKDKIHYATRILRSIRP
jgi:hypothetical protein